MNDQNSNASMGALFAPLLCAALLVLGVPAHAEDSLVGTQQTVEPAEHHVDVGAKIPVPPEPPSGFVGYVCSVKYIPTAQAVQAHIKSEENCQFGESLGVVMICPDSSMSPTCPQEHIDFVYPPEIIAELLGALQLASIEKQRVYVYGPFEYNGTKLLAFDVNFQGANAP